MTTKLETLPTPDKKSGGAGKPTNHRKPRESRGTLAFSRAQRGKSLMKHGILILAGGLMIYPLLWMVVSSLRPNELIFREPGLWLNSLEMSNYTSGWSALTHPFGHYMINSAIVVIGSILGNALLVLGASMLVGGLKNRTQSFAPKAAAAQATWRANTPAMPSAEAS